MKRSKWVPTSFRPHGGQCLPSTCSVSGIVLSIYLIPSILFNPFEDPSKYTHAFDFLVALRGMRDLSSPARD